MTIIPLSLPLRPVAEADDLPEYLWDVLFAICDTIIPAIPKTKSIEAKVHASADVLEEFLAELPSKNPEFCGLMRRILFDVLSIADRTLLIRVLKVLSYSAGSLVLTGSYQTLPSQPPEVRKQIVKNWSQSNLPPLRLLQRQLAFLTKQAWTRTSPSIPKVLGYPRSPIDCKVGAGRDFDFIQFPPGDEPEVIETDVVIVGSGCGGGVAAHTLAAAGLRVLVVDKGHYWSPEYLPVEEAQGPNRLFMDGGIMSDDGSVCVIAGETWGGGGTVNWSASLQPQGYVRREWADGGLPMFTSLRFQESCDRVLAGMGASTAHIQHTRANRNLLEGSRKLGWAHAEVPQNTSGTAHNCGHCCLGCRSGEKQGPASYWLPEAQKHGAKFIEGLDVHKVLFKNVNRERVATGVVGTWQSRDEYLSSSGKADRVKRKVIINASKVIVSAGTLQSPLLLIRSGINNYQVGRNLHLHPVSMLGAIYDEEMLSWDGPILTSVCSEFENLDGAGHGTKLETPSMTPYTWLVWNPWNNGAEYKELVARMRNVAGFISVARDRDTGRVYPDAVNGRCHVEYSPSQFDKRNIIEGIAALARINYVSGAREIFSMAQGLERFIRDDQDDEETSDAKFDEWVGKLRAHGFPGPEALWVSAHQMGTCRMSSSPKTGVVDESGRVWGTQGLHVMDASVFPSASGVNPMVTVMAIADYLCRNIVKQLTTEKL